LKDDIDIPRMYSERKNMKLLSEIHCPDVKVVFPLWISTIFSTARQTSRITRSLERARRSESDFALDNIGYQEQRRQDDETSLHGFVRG